MGRRAGWLIWCLVATSAGATTPYGVASWADFDPKLTRLGVDDGGVATVDFEATIRADVSALLLYVDEVRVPGPVAVALIPLFGLPTDPPVKTGTALVSAPGWVEFPLVGQVLGGQMYRLVISTSSCDLTLRHLHVPEYGADYPAGYSARPLAFVSRPGFPFMSTGLFRMASGTDPLADPSCGALGAVSGSPYAFARWVSLDAGPQEQQALAFVDGLPVPYGLGIFEAGTRGVVQWRTATLDGGTVDIGFGNATRPPFISEAWPRNSLTPPFPIIANAGDGEWMLLGAGAGLDVCHPAVRASFGGHRARAVGQAPGSDFAFSLLLRESSWLCRDEDGDSYGHAPCAWMVWWATPGWSWNQDDCDDTDAGVHPGAPEFCDGLDSDCDGLPDTADPSVDHSAPEQCNGVDDNCDALIDAADPALELLSCRNQVGLCGGSRHLPSDCVGGVWGECTTASYGPRFGSSELTCDSQDFNCDGVISTRVPCRLQRGVCAGASTSDCTRGVPSDCGGESYGPDYERAESRCDGLDNDCNGHVDDIPIQACDRWLGVCAGTSTTADLCQPLGLQPCGRRQYGPLFESTESSCDGFDNDCDGLTDAADPDLATGPCELTLGVCAAARHVPGDCTVMGRARCETERYGPLYQATESRCDGLDNDCDGVVDEGCGRTPPASPHDTFESTGCSGCSAAGPEFLFAALVLLRVRRAQGF